MSIYILDVQWPMGTEIIRTAERSSTENTFLKRSHLLNPQWNSMQFVPEVNNKVGFGVIFFWGGGDFTTLLLAICCFYRVPQ